MTSHDLWPIRSFEPSVPYLNSTTSGRESSDRNCPPDPPAQPKILLIYYSECCQKRPRSHLDTLALARSFSNAAVPHRSHDNFVDHAASNHPDGAVDGGEAVVGSTSAAANANASASRCRPSSRRQRPLVSPRKRMERSDDRLVWNHWLARKRKRAPEPSPDAGIVVVWGGRSAHPQRPG